MRKRGNISRYTAEELTAKEARGEDRTDWAAVTAKTEDELAADMASDPAWEGVPGDWVSRADAATAAKGVRIHRGQARPGLAREVLQPAEPVATFGSLPAASAAG